MLDSLRKAAGTWVAKLLLVLLVLSFAVWGISGSMMSGPGGTTVVQTGDTRVSVMDYRLAYDRQLSVLSQQLGQRITREQAQAFGVDDQVLQQLVAGALLDEQANQLGLGVSRDRLAELTMEDPAFQGANGQFDRQRFDYVLRQIGMRPEDYLKNREQVAVRQQIVEAVSEGIAAPDAFLRAVTLYQGESRTIDYVALQRSGDVDDPRAVGSYTKSGFSAGLEPKFVDAILDGFGEQPGGSSVFFLYHCGGAINRVSRLAEFAMPE